jgi:protein-disulfide isomerase
VAVNSKRGSKKVPPPQHPKRRAPHPKRREPEPSRTRLYAIVGGIALAIVAGLVAVSLLTGGDDDSTSATATGELAGSAETATLLRGIPQDGIALGSPDAPVTLVEYADLQCPFCAEWARGTFPAVVDEYVRPGEVRIEFRGLAFIGPDSQTALQTVLAAGEQDRLWNVLHLLWANQGDENAGWVTDDLLRGIGDSVAGLDSERMLSQRGAAAVEGELVSSQQSADLNGIDSTPSFLAGPTGGTLERLELTSLEPEEMRAALDALLDR